MKKIIQKYSLGKSLKTTLMAVLVLCTCQSYAGDYYPNTWISNGTEYSLVSHDALPSIGDYTCEARWDHVNKGHDASCGSCDGSIIVDGNYNVTGKFKVSYRYNGQTYEEGPFTESGDITIDHLCAGTYTNIRIISVSGGCSDKWPHDITIGGGDNNLHVDAGHDQSICKGESVQLCATGADHYEWSNGHTGACIDVSPDHDRTYSVTGTTDGCTDTDHVSVHVNEAKWDHVNKGHDASCGSCDGSIIVDANFNLTGKFNVEYTFGGQVVTEGPFSEASDITLGHLCAGTYSNITIVGVHTGCRDIWSHDITIGGGDNNLHVDAGHDQTICRGESVQLCATGADHYEWSNGETGECITVNPNSDKNYSVTGTSDGCSDTDHVSVHVNRAKWDNVEKGQDAGCGSCDGSIIIDADYSDTGEFEVEYTFDGQTVTEGPFMTGSNITLDHLCAGTYSDITIVGVHTGCRDVWSDDITIEGGSSTQEGGTIEIPGGSGLAGTTEIAFCINDTSSPFDVTTSDDVAGDNFVWVITDENSNILDLSQSPPFDFSNADEGVCLVWYLAYGDDLGGAEVGANAANLTGCFSLSNPITVTRTCCDSSGNPVVCGEECDEEGGAISFLIGSTNVDSLGICIDGTIAPLDVRLTGASATNSAWVITDENSNILDLSQSPPFDFSNADEGVCLVWHLAYGDDLGGAEVGANAANLTGCFSLSNPITVTRTCCDDDGNPTECQSDCQENKLDFTDPHIDWHKNSTSGSYDVGTQTYDIEITDNDHILELTRESNSGITVGIEPHDRHDNVVITYTLSEIASKVVFDIVDLDYKTGGSKQQEKVCVYGLLGNDDTQIMPTIESLDGSVAINGNCATATTNSSVSHDDESVLVTFDECVDQIVIVYGSGPDAPNNPSYSKIIIGDEYGFSTDVCPGECTAPASCEDYTLDFDEQGVRWHDNATSGDYDLGGQNVDININDDDHILQDTEEDDSGLQIGIDPHDRHDEVVITYTLSEVSSRTVFDIVDLDYKTGGSKQQEKVCVYGLLGDDDTQIMPTIESLDGSVAINGNCATATTNSAHGADESILVTFDECIDQVVIVYGSGPDAPSNPTYSKITIGEDYGFTSKVCPDACEAGGSSREDQSIADINIFPNPTNSSSLVTLAIETNITGRAHIVVMDKLGRSIIQLPIELTNTKDQYQLNTNGLSSGVYFVTLMTQEGQSQAQRLVILGE